MTPELARALVEETGKRSGLLWVAGGDRRPTPMWHLWHDGAAYLLTGDGEQPDPGLDLEPVVVTARSKDTGARAVVWRAAVDRVAPGSPEWDALVPLLLARRLNARDGADAPARWAAGCALHRLTPAEVLATPA